MAGGQGAAGRGGAPAIGSPPLRIGVRDLVQARAARAWAAYHGRKVDLFGLDAAATGVLFWRAVEERLGTRLVVDCGDRCGTVLQALRVGLRHLRHDVAGAQAEALAALLAEHGALRVRTSPEVELAAALPVPLQLARWSVVSRDRRHLACYETPVFLHPLNDGIPPCD